MSNVKKSWRDVTINEYFDLVDMINEEQEDYSKEVKTIAFVYNMEEDEVWNLSVPEFHRLQAGKAWMGKFEINTNAVFKSIKIGDMKCEINVSLMDFTVAQYIDFQTFWPHRDEMDKYIGNILACFIIPKGMKYNEGYDIQKLAETIRENVDIMTANEIIFFFLSSLLNSTRATLTYLKAKVMRTKRRMKDERKKESMEKVLAQIEELQRNTLDGFRLLTRSAKR